MASASIFKLTALPARVASRLQWEYREWRTPSRASFLQEELDHAMLDAVAWTPGERVLDVGCGTGIYSRKLIEKQLNITGLDMSSELLARAAANGLPLLQASGEQLPVANESFDTIFCHKTAYLFAQPNMALAEFHRVLRPGGRVLLSTSRTRSPYALAQAAAIRLSRNRDWGFNNRLGPGAWMTLATAAGFDVRTVYSCNLVGPIVFRVCDRWIVPNEWMRRFNRVLRRGTGWPLAGTRPRLLAQDFVLELVRR